MRILSFESIKSLLALGLALQLAACATAPMQSPPMARISPEELEKLIPKPAPNMTLDEIVALSVVKTPPQEIIDKIKQSHSQYDLTPAQVVQLSQQGVDSQVLDYMHQAREQALRDSFADEINKREREHQNAQEKLRQSERLRYQPFYDPFWGAPYPYYWRFRQPGSGLYYRYGW